MFTLPAPRRIRAPIDLISPFLALPELRGFWTAASIDENGNALDLSGQGRTLTNNSATPRAVYNSLVNYYDFDGTADYLSRADEAGLDVTGALTLGGWFWLDALPGANNPQFIGKHGGSGARAFSLQTGSIDAARFAISEDGTATFVVSSATLITSRWYFMAGTFTPAASLSVFLNEVETTATTTAASLFNSTAELRVGRGAVDTHWLNGRMALCFLCADNLPAVLLQSLFYQTRLAFGV